MTPVLARRAAWALWVIALVVMLSGGAINVIEPSIRGLDLATGGAFFVEVALVVFILFISPTLGALIIARHPQNVVGWFLYAAGLSAGTAATTSAATAFLRLHGDFPQLRDALLLLHQEAQVLTFPLLTFALLFFPEGGLPSPRWRPVALLMACAVALHFVLLPLASWLTLSGAQLDVAPSLGVAASSLRQLELLAVAPVAVSLAVRFRGAGERVRQQIKWVVAASIVGSVAYAAFWLPGGFAWTSTLGPLEIPVELVYVSAVGCMPASIGVAMLRHRLLDIDVIINRALVYGATVAAIGTLYVFAVVGLQAVLRPITLGAELPVALSTLGAIALFTPVRGRIQRGVDRRFYRSRYDATRTLDSLALRLRDQVDLDALRDELLTAVRDTMQPAHASLWLRSGK